MKQKPKAPKVPKVLVWDIETAPIKAWTWGIWEANIGLNQIIEDWSVMAVAWKWLGEKKVHYMDTRKDPRNDSELLATIWKLLNEADFAVGQNSIKFDTRKINARLIQNGYGPYAPVRHIDTMRQAKATGMFTSNKLEFLSKTLTDTPKSAHGKYPGFALWAAALAGDVKAWNEMRRYNIRDVEATEQLYLKLRPWDKQHPSFVPYMEDAGQHRCTRCGSTDLIKKGKRFTNAGEYTRLKCLGCGGWMTTRYTENSIGKRRSLLASQ